MYNKFLYNSFIATLQLNIIHRVFFKKAFLFIYISCRYFSSEFISIKKHQYINFLKEMCSSWISQSSCINVYIYEMFLGVSVSDGLAAQIVVRPQNALLPLVSGCVHTLNVAPFGNYVQLPCVFL